MLSHLVLSVASVIDGSAEVVHGAFCGASFQPNLFESESGFRAGLVGRAAE